MKKFIYRTKGTCSSQIELELDGNVVHLSLIHIYLVYGLFFDLPATFRTVRDTDPCIEQTEVIIYLCNCTHCRSRIAVG